MYTCSGATQSNGMRKSAVEGTLTTYSHCASSSSFPISVIPITEPPRALT